MNTTTDCFCTLCTGIPCDPRYNFSFLKFFYWILTFHSSLPYAAILYSFQNDISTIYTFLTVILSVLFGIVSTSINEFTKMKRPREECIPYMYSEYAFPDPAISQVVFSAFSILVYLIIYKIFSFDKKSNIWNVKKDLKYLGESCCSIVSLRIVLRVFNIRKIMFFVVVYPFLNYVFYLTTFYQMLFSVLYSVGASLLCSIMLIAIIERSKPNFQIRWHLNFCYKNKKNPMWGGLF